MLATNKRLWLPMTRTAKQKQKTTSVSKYFTGIQALPASGVRFLEAL